MKRTVVVTITKEIEVELTPAVFGPLSVEQYLDEFRKGLWPVDGLDDVFKYAAEMAAHYGDGTHDGLGLIGPHYSTYPRVPDVKFEVKEQSTESELSGGAA